MEMLPYEVKRAHWGATWVAIRRFQAEAERRPELEHMTPARFDILNCILERVAGLPQTPGVAPGIALRELVMKLGLSASTIGKCVKRMHELELVKRVDHERDGRCVIVEITERGARAAAAALELLGIDPNFIMARVRQWLGETGLAPAQEAYERWCAQARELAHAFDVWADPIYQPGYDHRAHFVWPNRPARSSRRTGAALPAPA